MKNLIVCLLVLCSTGIVAQTKLISHKSHSGNTADFKVALENNLFDISASNFGEAPVMMVKNASLDTVIYVSNEKSVMVTTNYCDDISRFETAKIVNSKVWNAGKDTVYNHPLFSRKHSLDSIKNVLKKQYNFRNDVEDVTFIGYDNKARKYKKESKKKKDEDKNKGFLMSPNNSNFPPKYVLFIAFAFSVFLLALVFQKSKLKNTVTE